MTRTWSFQVTFASTKISQDWVDLSPIKETVKISSTTHGSYVCAKTPWCQAFCIQDPETVDLLSLIAASSLDNPDEELLLDCFTKRSPGNILTPQSGITVPVKSQECNLVPMRPAENLLDGVYDLDNRNCFCAQETLNAFIVFDLQSTRTLQKVILLAQSDPQAGTFFRDIDVRFGTELNSPGDFTSYKQLGYLSATATANFQLVVQLENPVTGRYLSVQSMYASPKMMQICHAEIFE